MTRRPPLVATTLVVLAVAAMIALGIWQYQRHYEKRALIALYSVNAARSAPVAWPAMPPIDDRLLFRRASVSCLRVTGWRELGGRGPTDAPAWRHIAECRTGAEGPGALVQAGTSAEPGAKPRWRGGLVSGRISFEPDSRNLITRLAPGTPPLRPMLVLEAPVAGLAANALPDPRDLPDNHIAYMWQWFSFAGLAAAIYALALRQRWAREVRAPDQA